MKPFVLTLDTSLTPEQAWGRITDWASHGRYVPLTTIAVTTDGPNGIGTVFDAFTGIGRVGFHDPMEVVAWEPPGTDTPGRCRLEKRGRVMFGWAEIAVDAHGAGSRSTWTEQVRPKGLPRFADGLAAMSGRLLFGRVLRKLLAT